MKLLPVYLSLLLFPFLILLNNSHAQTHSPAAYKRSAEAANKIVLRILKTHPVIDGHNDFYHHFYDCTTCNGRVTDAPLDSIKTGNTNIPLYRAGAVSGQLYNVYGKDRKTENLIKAFDLMHQLPAAYPNDITIAGSARDLRIAIKNKKIALLPVLEGAVLLNDSKSLLRMYYKLGLRSVTMAYHTNNLADGSDDTAIHHGISAMGKEMIEEMNRLGIIIDMSHVSADAMRSILKASAAPVIFSHSNAYTLCKVNRNVPDDVLLELKKNKGIIMINFVPFFIRQQHADWLAKAEKDWKLKLAELKDTLATEKYYTLVWQKANPEPAVTTGDIADHFDYIKKLIGVDYIGIGSDLGDNYEYIIKGMDNVSCFPALLTELARRGWTATELKKITRLNFLRVFDTVEKQSTLLKKAG